MRLSNHRHRLAPIAIGLTLVGATLACSGGRSDDTTSSSTTTVSRPLYRSDTYADPAHWICRPDKDDVCDGDLDAAVIHADGQTAIERWEPAADPPVDCFYLYPTISSDPTPNSDLVPGALEEVMAVRVQAARLGSQCRVFAPVYRQSTLTTLWRVVATGAEPFPDEVEAIAYGDVLDAFLHYVSQDGGDRGFVLVGHSQGSTMLTRLLKEKITTDAVLRERLVAAYLLGLPPGNHPDPAVTPPCRANTQTGCVVAMSAYRATSPPVPGRSFFGLWNEPAACTNPASLAGGRAALHSYFSTPGHPWLAEAAIVPPFVTVPGMIEGECVSRDGYTYLEVTLNVDPVDPRADDLPKDFGVQWGMHLQDVQLVLGDLVELLGDQARAWAGRR